MLEIATIVDRRRNIALLNERITSECSSPGIHTRTHGDVDPPFTSGFADGDLFWKASGPRFYLILYDIFIACKSSRWKLVAAGMQHLLINRDDGRHGQSATPSCMAEMLLAVDDGRVERRAPAGEEGHGSGERTAQMYV